MVCPQAIVVALNKIVDRMRKQIMQRKNFLMMQTP
jgi:hypothetical protein